MSKRAISRKAPCNTATVWCNSVPVKNSLHLFVFFFSGEGEHAVACCPFNESEIFSLSPRHELAPGKDTSVICR